MTRSLAVVLAATVAMHAPAAAQQAYLPMRIGPPPGMAWTGVMTDAAVKESLAVLKEIKRVEKTQPGNAAAWYRGGMLGWALMYRARIGSPHPDLDWTLLGPLADTSLRIAMQLDPHNPRMILSTAQFFLGTGPMTMRAQSYHLFNRVYDLTKSPADAKLHAEAAIEVGRVHWRRYEGLANRRIEVGESDVLRSLAAMPSQLADASSSTTSMPIRAQDVLLKVTTATMALPSDLNGESDYLQAEAKFREAYALAPSDDRAFHELAMLFAEKKRWTELGGLAHEKIRSTPHDAMAWLALGLTLQRTHKNDAAAAAFDTALRTMEPRERAYLTRLQRVMSPRDTMAYAGLTAAERALREREYWLFIDPLWTHGTNYAYTEFLARVTYSELRWSVEELGQRGIDSDRGDIHVRYGPPTIEAGLGPAPQRNSIGTPLTEGGFGGFADLRAPMGASDPDELLRRASNATIWAYDVGWMIIFRGSPTYATARIAPEDASAVDSLVDASPSLWNNVSEERIRDMPTQVARFRAPRDSMDVLIATEPPVADFRELAGSNARIRADLWLFGRGNPVQIRDSSSLTTTLPRTWTYRLPSAQYAYRIETTAEGALLAGRSTDWIDGSGQPRSNFATRGFGISDLLLAAHAEERGVAKRWSDLDVAPIGGSVGKNASIALVWENYELGEQNGGSAYNVTITLERRYKMLLNRIKARVVGSLAAMVGVDRTEDRLIFRYERTAAAAPTIVDHLTIDLGDSPPGTYVVTLDITDHTTGKSTARTQTFIIRD